MIRKVTLILLSMCMLLPATGYSRKGANSGGGGDCVSRKKSACTLLDLVEQDELDFFDFDLRVWKTQDYGIEFKMQVPYAYKLTSNALLNETLGVCFGERSLDPDNRFSYFITENKCDFSKVTFLAPVGYLSPPHPISLTSLYFPFLFQCSLSLPTPEAFF